MPQAETAFVADAALRLDAPPRARDRSRLALAALAALVIESAVFALVWWERSVLPPPPLEEIPVEIVVEPPPPPPSPTPSPEAAPTPEPSPEMKAPDDEKPATEAPREGKSDHDDETVGKKEKPAASPPSPEPTPEPPKPAEAASPEPTPDAAKPPETPAPELPKAAEAEAPPPAKEETPKPPAPPKPATVAGLPKKFDDVPDVDFGGVAVKSDVTGGNAKAGFLPTLFGLIAPRMRVPPLSRAYGRQLVGVLVMVIDARGRLLQRYIREPSGSLELDEAAMEAVGAAARAFPPPPQRKTVGVQWRYTNN